MRHLKGHSTNEAGAGGWKAIAILVLIPVVTYLIWPRSYHLVRDRESDFSVRVPRGWDRAHSHKSDDWDFTRMAGLQPEGEINVGFIPVSNARAEPGANEISTFISRLRDQIPVLTVQQNEPTEVNGLKGYRLLYVFKKMIGGLPVEPHKMGEVVLWRQNQGMYVITLDTKYDTWDAYQADYEQVVESFRAPAE